MSRILGACQSLAGDKLHILEASFDDDLEAGLCADNHRRLLVEAIQRNEAITNCIQCGNPITSNGSEIIERQVDGEAIEVGLLHTGCTKSDDRIIGAIRSELFDKFPFLDGFDAETWFKEIELGQGAFEAVKAVRSEAMMLWAGRAPTTSNRDYVVEFLLADGSSEFAYKRGQLQRFTKANAEEAIARFEEAIKGQLESSDPLCFSDVSTTFATRSQIIKEFGAAEISREIRSVEIRKFDLRQAKQYDFWRHWYAPITYLWLPEHEQIFAIGESVILLTRPLELDRHLGNWRAAGVVPPNNEFKYELKIIRNDREFDDFAEEVFSNGVHLLVDPLLSSGNSIELLSGTRLLCQETFMAQHGQT